MQITVHSSRRLIALFCALVLAVLIFPNTGFAQQEATQSTTNSDDSGTSREVPVSFVPASYPKEGIPGGDTIVGDFVVGPGKVDVTLNPGESKVIEMIVTNRTGERRVFNLKTEDMTGSRDLSKPVILLGSDRGPYSLRDYLLVDHQSFELDQNQRARIPVTISIPKDAEPGGLYGSMLVDTVAIEATSGETTNTVPQSAIVARIGTLFFVTVAGEVAHSGKLLDFATIGKQKFFGSSPVTFGILHENTGSIHIAPYGEVRVTNMLGDEVGFVELESWFILPGSERLREITWSREFVIGRYTATAQINRGYDDIVDTASFTFWVLPWKYLTLGFGVIFVVLFLIRTFLRTFEFKRKR